MNFSDDELRRALEENETECFSTFKVLGPAVQLDETESATLLTTPSKFWLFNPVMRVRVEPANSETAVARWLAHYRSKQRPFGVFLYPHSTSQELEEALRRNGFEHEVSTTVVFDSKNLESFQVPLLSPEFRRLAVRDLKEFEAYSSCWGSVFKAPAEVQEAFNNWSKHYGFRESHPMQNIAIMDGDRAAAIATYFLDSKIAGIYSIGVHPDYRRRGLGLQIARDIALAAQARGVRYLVGNGSDEGMHVYRKAGVREIGLSHRWIHG